MSEQPNAAPPHADPASTAEADSVPEPPPYPRRPGDHEGAPETLGPPPGARLDPVLGVVLAPWWRRALAIVMDLALLNLVNTVWIGLLPATDRSRLDVVLSLAVIVELAYFALLEGSPRGQTLGKAALGIAAKSADGAPLTAARALLRRFVFVALFSLFLLPGVANVLAPLMDRRRQAWHDKVASSIVVVVAPTSRPPRSMG